MRNPDGTPEMGTTWTVPHNAGLDRAWFEFDEAAKWVAEGGDVFNFKRDDGTVLSAEGLGLITSMPNRFADAVSNAAGMLARTGGEVA